MSVHWSDDYSRWLKRHFPEVAEVPLYLRLAGEIPGIERQPDALAWTGAALDVRLRPILEPRGEWIGRGLGIVLEAADEFFSRTWPEQLGVILHETAHGFESWDSPQRRAEFRWTNDDEWLAQPGNTDLVCARLGLEPITDAEVALVSHGSQFTRAALHCWWRCRHEIPLNSMHIFGDRYGSPDPLAAIEALDDELRTAGNIVDVMRTPMPDAFAKLWTT